MTGELVINNLPLLGEAVLLNQGGNPSAGGAVSRESVFYALISQSLAQATLAGQSQEQAVHISDAESDGIGKILWDLSGVKLGEMISPGLKVSPPEEDRGEALAEELPPAVPEVHISAVNYQAIAVEKSLLPDVEKAAPQIVISADVEGKAPLPDVEKAVSQVVISADVERKAPEPNLGKPGRAQLQNTGLEPLEEGGMKTNGIPVLTSKARGDLPETVNTQKTATMSVTGDADKSESLEKAISRGTHEIAKNNLEGPTFQAVTGLQETETLKSPVRAAEIPEPYSQIGKEIQAKLQQKGPMEFSMQLEPKDLGKIDVTLRIKDGKLIIDIMAASSKTHSLLTGQIDKLVMSMGLQNVRVENVQVSQQADFSGSDKQEQSSFAGRENSYHQESDRDNHSQHWRSGQNSQLFDKSVADMLGREPDYECSPRYEKAQKSSFTRMDYII